VARREEEIIMFLHAGPRPLWPIIVFLPWLLLGFAYLIESLLRRRAGSTAIHHMHAEEPPLVRSSAREERQGRAASR
jgi:hypothetical protein